MCASQDPGERRHSARYFRIGEWRDGLGNTEMIKMTTAGSSPMPGAGVKGKPSGEWNLDTPRRAPQGL